MFITGVQKLTLLDYPGHISAIIFTGGCTMRCGFCHNPEFVLPESLKKLQDHQITEKSVLRFLMTRKNLLDGVVVCGGEPTLHHDLPEFLTKIKAMGFQTKLDTNGANPRMLQKLLHERLVDYIAMDYKHTIAGYPSLTLSDKGEQIRESIATIKTSQVDYEFRSTIYLEYIRRKSCIKWEKIFQERKSGCCRRFEEDIHWIQPMPMKFPIHYLSLYIFRKY